MENSGEVLEEKRLELWELMYKQMQLLAHKSQNCTPYELAKCSEQMTVIFIALNN